MYKYLKARIGNRGIPPDGFLDAIFAWAKTMPLDFFGPNNEIDIFSIIKVKCGPWTSAEHRRASMLYAGIVHAGYESSWRWNEAVDTTNQHSMENKTGEETGIFQVSYDSEHLDHDAMRPFALAHGLNAPEIFIEQMKNNHPIAIEYYMRLIRFNVQWAGPLKNGLIVQYLQPEPIAEAQSLLLAA